MLSNFAHGEEGGFSPESGRFECLALRLYAIQQVLPGLGRRCALFRGVRWSHSQCQYRRLRIRPASCWPKWVQRHFSHDFPPSFHILQLVVDRCRQRLMAARQKRDRRNGCGDGPQEIIHRCVGDLFDSNLLGAVQSRKNLLNWVGQQTLECVNCLLSFRKWSCGLIVGCF